MTDDKAPIVIEGHRDDWPDGPRTLKPRAATREPNGTLWFGAEIESSGDQVWFRIEEDAIRRMPEKTPGARGRHLIDALLTHVGKNGLQPRSALNRFEVRVSDTGDTWIERLRW